MSLHKESSVKGEIVEVASTLAPEARSDFTNQVTCISSVHEVDLLIFMNCVNCFNSEIIVFK